MALSDSEVKVTAIASISINDMISITLINAMPCSSPLLDNRFVKYFSVIRIIVSKGKMPSYFRGPSPLVLLFLIQAFAQARKLADSPGLVVVTAATQATGTGAVAA